MPPLPRPFRLDDFAEHLLSIHAHRAFLVCGDTTWAKSGAAERVEALAVRAGLTILHRFAAKSDYRKKSTVPSEFSFAEL